MWRAASGALQPAPCRTPPRLEDPLAVAEKNGRDIDRQFVDHIGGKCLANRPRAAGDVGAVLTRSLARSRVGGLKSPGDEKETVRLIRISTTGLTRSFKDAAKLRKIHVSQEYFSARYEGNAEWAIGPFTEDASLTFSAQEQWPDPTGTGWTSSAIFNPSLLTDGDRLVLFYRASPSMESMSSRIGVAIHDTVRGWMDSELNPIIYPTLDNELYGCEDPKVYRHAGRYFLFYQAVFPIDPVDADAHPSPGFPLDGVGCDLNLAVSDDLRTWTKLGPVVPHSISRLWCKGAVVPRDPEGNAIRINGEFLMYLSEGCNGTFQVGRSDDLIHWTFEETPYLDLTPLRGTPARGRVRGHRLRR